MSLVLLKLLEEVEALGEMMKRNIRSYISFLLIVGLLTLVPNTSFAPYREEGQVPPMTGMLQQPFAVPPGTSIAYMPAYIPVLVNNIKTGLQGVQEAPTERKKRRAMTNVIRTTGSGIATLLKEGVKITGREIFKSVVSPSFWVKALPMILILILLIRYRNTLIGGAQGAQAVWAQIMGLVDQLERAGKFAGSIGDLFPSQEKLQERQEEVKVKAKEQVEKLIEKQFGFLESTELTEEEKKVQQERIQKQGEEIKELEAFIESTEGKKYLEEIARLEELEEEEAKARKQKEEEELQEILEKVVEEFEDEN